MATAAAAASSRGQQGQEQGAGKVAGKEDVAAVVDMLLEQEEAATAVDRHSGLGWPLEHVWDTTGLVSTPSCITATGGRGRRGAGGRWRGGGGAHRVGV